MFSNNSFWGPKIPKTPLGSSPVPCSCCFPFAVPNAVAPHRMENVTSEQDSSDFSQEFFGKVEVQ